MNKQFYKFFLFLIFFSSAMFCYASETKNDSLNSTSNTSASSKRIILSIKGGIKFAESANIRNTESGIAFSTGLAFHLGKNFYLKPSISFWESDARGWNAWEKETVNVFGYMLGGEYVINFDSIAITVGFAPGYFTSGDDGMIGILIESGIVFPIKDSIAIYLGGAYQPSGSLNFGGGGRSFAPFILYAGMNFKLK